ncbi:MAG: dTDP-4-amino-4,6-dideoxygalactose transaminase [Hyphomicrobium sp.]|nr:MAG: dTDP-4-amino-4,6-dideoxygalactose transaminase [Hyphomicrobium sp.]MBZ0210810.1 dTDP-4-amino-4,6-dideoxygalactose transaminase [Hyphomicrobium sp.]
MLPRWSRKHHHHEDSVHPAVPFNRAPIVGREIELITEALQSRHLAADGVHSRWCQNWICERLSVPNALLTTSCTKALELAAMLCDIGPGDEVIMPSFTFVSTANAVVMQGGTPVFVDMRPDTLNIDEALVEDAITPRTKAIFVVHYAGVCADMDAINAIARHHGLVVVEDAAQAILSTYKGRPAGALADMGCFSFHETKNIVSGEGGAIALSPKVPYLKARVIAEKGTNRTAFMLGQVDKYTWVDKGSSLLPSEITAAFLQAQLEQAEAIIADRMATWSFYHSALAEAEKAGLLRRPIVPVECTHNAHIYYVLLPSQQLRNDVIADMKARNVSATFHYIPLHSSPAGKKLTRTHGAMTNTDTLPDRLVRLPLWYGMGTAAELAVEALLEALRAKVGA